MKFLFSLGLPILASLFTHAASEDGIFGRQDDRIVCTLAMVEFFPAKGRSHIPSELRCIEKDSPYQSYILSNLPDNLREGTSGDNAYLLNTLVSIPVSRARNDSTIINLNYDSKNIQFFGTDGDNSAVERTFSKQFEGTSSAVVIRVTSGDGFSPTKTAAELSDDIFGTNGDLMNLKTGYQACSGGKLNFVPGTGPNIVDGVMEISISQSVNGVSSGTVEGYVKTKLSQLGYNLSSYTHTMVVVPAQVDFGGAAAWAYMPGDFSFYSDGNASMHIVLMHEIGHNLGHHHSGLGSYEYADPTCMMGNVGWADESPKKCFNAAKSWASGWYSDRHETVSTSISKNLQLQLVGVDDYVNDRFTSDQQRVVVKIGTNLYMMYNRAKGVNAETGGYEDKVVIVQQTSETGSTSWVRAALGVGESYQVTSSVSVKVTAIVNGQTDSTLDYAAVTIGNPNTLAPNSTPTVSPAPSIECDDVKIIWSTDPWSIEDNGFTITNIATGAVIGSVPVGSLLGYTNYEFDYCIPTKSDCYEFKAVDTWADDGLTSGNLSFQVNGDELLAVTSGDEIWTEKSVEFGGSCAPNKPPTTAPNKSPTARPNKPPTASPTNVPTEAPTSSDDSISFKNKVGNNVCMGVKGFYGGAPVITKSCSSTDNQQKFQFDDKGRIHLYTRPEFCLKKAKAVMKVAKCGGTNIFKFAYNGFDSRLVYYPAPLANVVAIANDTPGFGKAIKLVSFNNNAQTQGWETK
jgi:hypothetical protein